MTRRQQPVHEQIEQAEALFLVLMSPNAMPEDWDQYEDLVRTSPEHREVFARCETIWQDLDEIGAVPLSDIGFAMNTSTAENVHLNSTSIVRPGGMAGSTGSSVISGACGWFEELRWSWAIAAMMVALVIVGGLGIQYFVSGTPEVVRYATQTREHREIDLPDGSTLLLGGRSSIFVRYTKATRLIELRSGEVLATVSHDESRPFILVTDDLMVLATGTSFNVRNGGEYSTVSVVEGTVRVVPQVTSDMTVQLRANTSAPTPNAFDAGATLRHGQQLRAGRNTELGVITEVDIGLVVSWQSGQLYFLEDDLSTVFEAVMRYSDVTFKLTDQTIGERIYTGSFRPDSLEAWLDAMEQAYSLKATRISSDWIVLAPTG